MDNGELCYARFLVGDKSAFDTLIDMYRDNLIYFINGYVHNTEDAEDLASDTFCELLVHKGRYQKQSLFKTYLYGIARHKALDHLRREKRRFTYSIDDGFESLESGDDPEGDAIIKEEREALRKAISSLIPDYAEILTLIYLRGLTSDEAALVMKKTKKQMANLLYRSKEALKKRLEGADI